MPTPLSSADVMNAALCLVNNPNGVSNILIAYVDGTRTAGWYASRIQLGASTVVTLTSRPEAGQRPTFDLDFSKVAYLLIELSDGRDMEFGTKPAAPKGPQEVAAQLNHGEMLRRQGDLAGAQVELEAAVPLARQIFAPNDPNRARAVSSLATLCFDRAEFAQARALYQESLDGHLAAGPETPDVALMLDALGQSDSRLGNAPSAEALTRRALDLYRRLGAEREPGFPRALHNLAVLRAQAGHYQEAYGLFKESLERRWAMFGERHPDTMESLASLGTFWVVQGNPAQAEPLYRQALGIAEQVLGEKHLLTAEQCMNVALCVKQKRTYAAAEEAFPFVRRAHKIRAAILGDAHPLTRSAENEVTAVARALGLA
ncbi:MAG: tetratricopeptide repeat protein [Polyangiaceae bacterium]